MTAAPAVHAGGEPVQVVEPEVNVDASALRPAAFLDRDGVINRRRTLLVRHPDDLELLPGSGPAIARLNEAGYLVLVATNQPAVGWGWVKDLNAIHERMDELLAEHGAAIDHYFACTHRSSESCACRKPLPGMLTQGALEMGLEPENCWMVGDRPTDVEAGKAFGARTAWITGSRRYPWEYRWEVEADVVAKDLAEAVEAILSASGLGR